jgi:hypothetical protein
MGRLPRSNDIDKPFEKWRQTLLPARFQESNAKVVISFLDHVDESRNVCSLELSLRSSPLRHNVLCAKGPHTRNNEENKSIAMRDLLCAFEF